MCYARFVEARVVVYNISPAENSTFQLNANITFRWATANISNDPHYYRLHILVPV